MADKTKSAGRLAFIDWTRGVAAVVMLQGHTFNSFTRDDLRDKGPYMLSQFVGGLPPAIFLFLTGITFAFLMHSQEKRAEPSGKRVRAALRRSGYLFLIAFLFRLQLYVFGYPNSPASELLKVDILNCMGMAMLVLAPMAVFTTIERARLCTLLGLLIAGLAPVITQIDNPAIPWLIRAYFVPNLNYFSFFPWAAFLAFGMAAGSVIRLTKQEDMSRVMVWNLALSLVMILMSQYLGNLPYSVYAKSDYWLNSPALTIIKLAVTMAMLSVAFIWVNVASLDRWSLFRQLGTTSLLVYWVHIELVYGRWFGFWKNALTVTQVMVYSILLIALMTVLSLASSRRELILNYFRPNPLPQPRPASGD